jgi:4-hydroxybenzoate polyprenyltransferase
MLAFAWVYSMGPRLKRIPLVGSLANLGNFAPLLFVGMHGDALPAGFAAVAVAFCAILLQNQLIHEAGDATEDRGGGIRTTWLTLGPAWTTALAAALGLVAAVAAAGAVSPALRAPAALLSAAVFAAAHPLLLWRRAADPPAAARLRLTQRAWAVLFGAALYLAWRWSGAA